MPKGVYKRAVVQKLTSKQKWALDRKPTPQDMMLSSFMSAPTPEAKRAVIEQFNELYFIFNKEIDHEHELQTSV